jgi:hypothetical protein
MLFSHGGEGREHAQRLDLGLIWDVGAPCPHLLHSEGRTFLAFLLPVRLAGVPSGTVTVVDAATDRARGVGVVEWLRCRAAAVGWPNDEVLHGHRLWSKGLSKVGPYLAAEIVGSGWIEDMEIRNRAHPSHQAQMFSGLRHFLLSFKDSTFECVAEDYECYEVRDSFPAVLAVLARCASSDEPLPYAPLVR